MRALRNAEGAFRREYRHEWRAPDALETHTAIACRAEQAEWRTVAIVVAG